MTAPGAGGTYILFVEVPAHTSIGVGRLGLLDFEAGTYGYVGSAHGPGGLAARLGRYIAGPERRHWHIDWLLEHAVITGTLFRVAATRLECEWAQWMDARSRYRVPGFGSSDCRCSSHLYFVGGADEAEQIMRDAGCELKAIRHSEGEDGP